MRGIKDSSRTARLALLLCALVASAMSSCEPEQRKDGPSGSATTVRVGWQVAWATQGQIAQALERTNALDNFALRGDFRSFTYGAPLSEAALANELDVAFVGDQPAINLISRTPEWKIVARLMDFRAAIVVPPDSPIKTVADLRGKTLGIPFGASTHRVALQKLREAGLDPSKDLQILNIDIQEQGDLVNAAKGGRWDKVDAFASWDHHIALYESKGLARVLTSGTALGVVMMSERFIRAHPDAAANFLAAYKLAYHYYATHQDQANDWFSAAAQGKFDQAILREVAAIEPNLKASSIQQVDVGLGPEHVATLQAAADFAAQQKLITGPVNITNAINTSLARDAEAKIVGDAQSRVSAVR